MGDEKKPATSGDGENRTMYHLHTPFNPTTPSPGSTPVYTGGGGGSLASGVDSEGKNRFISYDTALGSTPGMTTCTSCQQQVMTNVTYKAGTYAWLMCLLFICCGLVLCCCLIPFFLKSFKDAYHTCPRCNRVLHVEKKKCCKWWTRARTWTHRKMKQHPLTIISVLGVAYFYGWATASAKSNTRLLAGRKTCCHSLNYHVLTLKAAES